MLDANKEQKRKWISLILCLAIQIVCIQIDARNKILHLHSKLALKRNLKSAYTFIYAKKNSSFCRKFINFNQFSNYKQKRHWNEQQSMFKWNLAQTNSFLLSFYFVNFTSKKLRLQKLLHSKFDSNLLFTKFIESIFHLLFVLLLTILIHTHKYRCIFFVLETNLVGSSY